MKRITLGITFLLCFTGLILMTGCSPEEILDDPENISGGIVDRSDKKAPKEIESHELVSFHTSFYRWPDDAYTEGRGYTFDLTKSEDGTFCITESENDKIQCQTDDTFAKKLEELIREYDLIELNGVNKITSGLPPECGPCSLRAEFVSGEKMSFRVDGDPQEPWTRAVLDLFAIEFGDHGIEDLLPSLAEETTE